MLNRRIINGASPNLPTAKLSKEDKTNSTFRNSDLVQEFMTLGLNNFIEKFNQSSSKDDIGQSLSGLFQSFNTIKPFSEGNTQTALEYIKMKALEKNFEFNFDTLSIEESGDIDDSIEFVGFLTEASQTSTSHYLYQ
jgi:fido (protein-threonine AMPylation protein)